MFAKDKVSQSLIDSVNKVLDKKESEQLNEAFPTVADAKKRASEPKPSGGSGVKLGTRYGGGRQKDEPEHDDDEPKEKRGKYGARQKRFTNTKLYSKEDLTFTDRLIESMYGKKGAIPMDEKEMTPAQAKKKEEIVMSMKDNTDQFKKKYGKRWKEVMYATATKQAMKEDADQIDEKIDHSQRTTDTLAGRTKGGKDNEHSSYKVAYKHEDTDVEESGLRMAAHAAAKQGKKSFEFQGKTMPVTVKKEEVEELDELSKSTVKSYVLKKMHQPTTTKKDVDNLGKAYARLKDYKPTSEEVELDEMKNTPANKPPYKLKSFSSLKKEMLGKAGMTSEGKSDEE